MKIEITKVTSWKDVLNAVRFTQRKTPLDQEPFCYLLGNLMRLAVGCFYEIPSIKPPVVSKDAFENSTRVKKSKTTKKK